ncbi:hypothetical protein H7X46_21945 [Pseudonocardia sp. C8]|uniref:hypothetical protein n=1 Tax=Pseudonocardia sp. C8 TaxID=2762759 RepID=UPI001643087F|nr:hypothetical protein [Pseudonocardia sp. C8]MBC3193725.1 hypothetical protein [Pseudonocardia sp. C8]
MPERRPAALVVCAAALTGLLAGALSGCTGPGPSGSPPPSAVSLPKYYDPAPLLADVDARTRSDGAATLSVAGTLTGAAGPVPVTGDGAVRLDPGGAGPAVRLALRSGPEGTVPRSVELVRVGSRTWFRPAGTGWSEAGRSPLPPAAVADATLAANVAAGVDPLAAVARYPDAVLVAEATDTDVDGIPAVHYVLVVDLGRALATENDPARREALAAQHRAGITRMSAEIWLDADRRPLRSRLRQQLPGTGVLDLLIRYRDWGAPVTIEGPLRGS